MKRRSALHAVLYGVASLCAGVNAVAADGRSVAVELPSDWVPMARRSDLAAIVPVEPPPGRPVFTVSLPLDEPSGRRLIYVPSDRPRFAQLLIELRDFHETDVAAADLPRRLNGPLSSSLLDQLAAQDAAIARSAARSGQAVTRMAPRAVNVGRQVGLQTGEVRVLADGRVQSLITVVAAVEGRKLRFSMMFSESLALPALAVLDRVRASVRVVAER